MLRLQPRSSLDSGMKVLNGCMTELWLWKEVPWVVEMPVLEASHSRLTVVFSTSLLWPKPLLPNPYPWRRLSRGYNYEHLCEPKLKTN